jgi:hypothetical protein
LGGGGFGRCQGGRDRSPPGYFISFVPFRCYYALEGFRELVQPRGGVPLVERLHDKNSVKNRELRDGGLDPRKRDALESLAGRRKSGPLEDIKKLAAGARAELEHFAKIRGAAIEDRRREVLPGFSLENRESVWLRICGAAYEVIPDLDLALNARDAGAAEKRVHEGFAAVCDDVRSVLGHGSALATSVQLPLAQKKHRQRPPICPRGQGRVFAHSCMAGPNPHRARKHPGRRHQVWSCPSDCAHIAQ